MSRAELLKQSISRIEIAKRCGSLALLRSASTTIRVTLISLVITTLPWVASAVDGTNLPGHDYRGGR
jgi:hypothetical protein